MDAGAAARNPAVNSLYLCPFIPLWQLTDVLDRHPTFGRDNAAAVVGMIGYDAWPLWMGTGLLYLVVGLACYGFALTILRRRSAHPSNMEKGEHEVRPYTMPAP